jgi:hypothetical protein
VDGPLVLVGAYLLVRCVHLTLYGVAAAGDRGLRRQLAITWGPLLVAIGVLLAALPAAIALPPLVGLAGSVLILAALIVVETTRYAQTRRSLRDA